MKIPGTRLLVRIVLALLAVAAVAIAATGCSAIKDASKSDTAKEARKIELKGKVDKVNVPTENKMKTGELINFL